MDPVWLYELRTEFSDEVKLDYRKTAAARPQVYKGLLVCRSIENPPIK